MSDKVSRFCDRVHEKLATLAGRMDSFKLNVGTARHTMQENLDEARHKSEAAKQAVAEARTNMEQWVEEKKVETKATIDRWVKNGETQKLAARARKAEECAGMAIAIALASIDDAERMALEAITAGRDAEAVTVG